MPVEDEVNDICKRLFTAVQSFAPKTEYEEFYKIVEKREKSYEETYPERPSEWNYTGNTYGKKI